ncbi:MAG TPA: single-stranded-DNA-specific exonuclease RecJ, partial [Psychromonas sp.]
MPSLQVKKRTTIDPASITLPCSPLLKQLYINRGIKSEKELDNSTKNLLHAQQLKGITEACELLYEAFLSSQKIIVVGDFDADGATSTALSILA